MNIPLEAAGMQRVSRCIPMIHHLESIGRITEGQLIVATTRRYFRPLQANARFLQEFAP